MNEFVPTDDDYPERDEKKFSVIVPTKGRSFLIRETIESILAQNFEDFELVIVDNDDDDSTAEVIRMFDDQRIVYIRTGNLSMADNWQAGLDAACARFIILSEDKILLKRDALSVLDRITNENDVEIITFDYDPFYDIEGLYLPRSSGTEKSETSSSDIIKLLMKSRFDEFANYSPRGNNACISSDLIKRAQKKVGRICQPLAPDYMMAYHLLLNSEMVLHLPFSLNIARFKSYNKKEGYGNGGNYFIKGPLWESFLRDQNVPISTFYDFVPIKVLSVYNFLMSDFFRASAMYDDKDYTFDRISYYVLNYKETSSRSSHGVDVDNEFSAWRDALKHEPLPTRIAVLIKLFPQYIKEVFYRPYRFIEKTMAGKRALRYLGRQAWEKNFIKYENINDCLKTETCDFSLSRLK